MSLLKLPSQKILAQYLQHCIYYSKPNNEIKSSESTDDAVSNAEQWVCKLPNLNLLVSHSVWIQGIVVEILDCDSTVAIDDGTGIIMLTKCDSVAVKVALKKGMYLMAAGALLSVGQQPVVKPFKLQDLSDDSLAETMWPLEVLDQILFLTSQTHVTCPSQANQLI
ncbi:hypothetical protein Btru_007631 [Bulinus truncatus]|nr:hypothetical protein Btru_007631 [Bulinus truncatus]